MPELKTMGDLRKFLTQAMQDVRAGTLDQARAGQIAKLAAQVNASVHAEIAARAHLELKGGAAFSALVIADGVEPAQLPAPAEEYIGTRPNGQPLDASDWPAIEKMMNKQRFNITKIAEIYKVDFKKMRDFIDSMQQGF